MRITLTNWDKYNPRKDLKSMNWIKLQSSIIYDPKFFYASPGQKWFFVFLICHCANEMSGTVSVPLDWLALHSGLTRPEVEEALTLFDFHGILSREEDRYETDLIGKLKNRPEPAPEPEPEHKNDSFMSEDDKKTMLWKFLDAEKVLHDADDEQEAAKAENELFQLAQRNDSNIIEHKEKTLKYDDIQNLWNAQDWPLPQCQIVTEKRKKLLKTAFKTMPTINDWIALFIQIKKSDFLMGKNDKGWRCDFDWCLKTDNIVKIMEGKYESTSHAGGSKKPFSYAEQAMREAERYFEDAGGVDGFLQTEPNNHEGFGAMGGEAD